MAFSWNGRDYWRGMPRIAISPGMPLKRGRWISYWCTRSRTASRWGHRRAARCSPKAPAVGTSKTLPANDADDPFTETVGKVAGFPLHAGVAARADERKKLERLCRYIARSAVSEKRLCVTPIAGRYADVRRRSYSSSRQLRMTLANSSWNAGRLLRRWSSDCPARRGSTSRISSG